MRPNERRRIAEYVRDKYRDARNEPEPMIEEALTIEEKWEDDLCGCDRHFLEDCGVCL